VVIGTAGVIMGAIKVGTLDVSRLKVFVIDEADEMILNQKRDVEAIHRYVGSRRWWW